MVRFYFDVYDSQGWHTDDFGVDLQSLEEAREQAIALLPDIARSELPAGERHQIACRVRDAACDLVYEGELVFTGRFLLQATADFGAGPPTRFEGGRVPRLRDDRSET